MEVAGTFFGIAARERGIHWSIPARPGNAIGGGYRYVNCAVAVVVAADVNRTQ